MLPEIIIKKMPCHNEIKTVVTMQTFLVFDFCLGEIFPSVSPCRILHVNF